ncbi:MDR family MFS transporter [Ketogulonicigenium vulgare]|uniref:MDR family MFS transporter n=1 Tax=Ketogulonicigenium vulgare TaxID=92945 RepID=UPI00235864B4|nr:MDR family MFS transporter [Ketogulonicigenium vulgare]
MKTTDHAPAKVDRKSHFLIISTLIAMFMSALEQTITGPAMGNIAAELGGGTLLTWVPTAYLMAATCSASILGALADIKGRRFAINLSVGTFVVGSVMAAMSTSLTMLVISRVVQGIGAGGLTALPHVVIADRIPMRQRPIYSAYTSTIYAIAAVMGPIAGGVLSQYFHWSAIFWINLPLGVLCLIGVAVFYTKEGATTPRPVDTLGAGLMVGAALSSVMALNTLTSGQPGGLVWLAVALVFWAAFALRMVRAAYPLLPFPVLTNPTILLCGVGLLCCTGANVALSVYLPLYYQQSFGLTASQGGFAVIGFLIGVTAGAYIPPRFLRNNPYYKPVVVSSTAVALAGTALLCLTLAQAHNFVLLEMVSILLGMGIGASYPIFTLAAQNAAGARRVGAALGLLGFARAMGGTIGVAVAGAVALASGLVYAHEGVDGPMGEATWVIALVPAGLIAVAFIAMLLLPPKALEGYGAKR